MEKHIYLNNLRLYLESKMKIAHLEANLFLNLQLPNNDDVIDLSKEYFQLKENNDFWEGILKKESINQFK